MTRDQAGVTDSASVSSDLHAVTSTMSQPLKLVFMQHRQKELKTKYESLPEETRESQR